MKIKSLLTILSVIVIFSCSGTSKKQEFLFLNVAQLKSLGINVTDQGVFYKNSNPNWLQDKERFATLAFYLGDDNYVSTFHMKETDTLVVKSKSDSLLNMQTITKNDFYPLLIGNTKGNQSLNQDLPEDMKLLPVAICMADTKLPNRIDTLIVWFKPTESLKTILSDNIKIDEYLQPKPIEKK